MINQTKILSLITGVVNTGDKLITSVNDTGGKFIAGVNDTGHQFIADVNNTAGKFITSVNDTGHKHNRDMIFLCWSGLPWRFAPLLNLPSPPPTDH